MLKKLRLKHPKLNWWIVFLQLLWLYRKAAVAEVKQIAKEYRDEWKEYKKNGRTLLPSR